MKCLIRCSVWVVVLAMVAMGCSCGEDQRGTETGDNAQENRQVNDDENVNQDQNVNDDDSDPQLEVSGEENLSWELEFESSDSAQFEVSNVGGGTLEFEIESFHWLDLDPVEGEASAGETVVIEAEVSCEKGEDIERFAAVEITSNGGDYEFESDLYCGELPPGLLQVNVDGLSDGVDHDIDAVAELDGASVAVPQDGEITLEPGDYEVIPNPVAEEGVEYQADPVDAELIGGETTEVDIDYEAIPAELPVVISGLPDGVDADVELVGQQETVDVTESETVELIPGEYDVQVGEVTVGDKSYAVTEDVVDTVTVESGPNGELEIEYELVLAELEVEIAGQLDGNDADVQISGPDGFSASVTDSESFDDLEPGEYTVEAFDVIDGDWIYAADGGETVELESGDSETVVITYELISGDIEVVLEELGDTSYELQLTGPDGFEEPLDSDASFFGAPVGDYAVEVQQQPVDPYGNDSYVDISPADFQLGPGDQQTVDIEVRAAYLVINEDNSGDGSLRFVVDDVGAGTVVKFLDSVSEVGLTGSHIEVDQELTIQGRSDDPVVVDGNGSTRLFRIEAGGDLTMTDLVLSDGFGNPGGAGRVVDDGTLVLKRVTVQDNESVQAGGALAVTDSGTVEIYDSLFANNTADGWGSALDVPQFENDVTVIIHRSLFRDNVAGGNGGAVDTSGTLEIAHSTFVDNESEGRVGAVMVFAGTATLEGLTVVGNSIEEQNFSDDTGGVYVNSSASATIRGNIIAENKIIDDDDYADLGGTVQEIDSEGFNVIGEVDNQFQEDFSDELGVNDAGLEDLADNGGYTETKIPDDGSEARAMMFGDECFEDVELDWTTDQRGAYRPAGAFCSAGAAEVDGIVEQFDDADMSRTSFNGSVDTFTGVEGIEWDYYRVKRQEQDEGDDDVIDGTSVVLEGGGDGWIAAPDAPDGIASISVMLAPAGNPSGEHRVEIFVDGDSVGQSPDVSGETEPYLFAVELDDEVDGTFDLTIESSGDEDVVVDNVSWSPEQ